MSVRQTPAKESRRRQRRARDRVRVVRTRVPHGSFLCRSVVMILLAYRVRVGCEFDNTAGRLKPPGIGGKQLTADLRDVGSASATDG